MEKYSAYRDPGTGIQPFLTPVPSLGSDSIPILVLPVKYALGFVRFVAVCLLGLLYALLVDGVCLIFQPIGPLHRVITRVVSALLCRTALLLLGFIWIPAERLVKKRGRLTQSTEAFAPGAGDLIVSNWMSWVELLYLAFRFNPVFVLPVSSTSESASAGSTSGAQRTGRGTGTGSANVSTPSNRPSMKRTPIKGFRAVSLLSIIKSAGLIPEVGSEGLVTSLESIRSSVGRPVVVFPECTTSNGRGLLRFAEIFTGIPVPVKKFKVFVLCFRCDPPTALAPTISHSIPTSLNPLAHVFALASSLAPLTLSVRLLAPSDSPSSGSFMPSEIVGTDVGEDVLAASCQGLIMHLGKFKKLSFGWEDKAAFLDFYSQKRR
ncbi:hypothetical protein PENSPDRAFT_743948 [Peniophora sp. CONT]|nr:hypothetical protein PENSPDRAFT_743948 [Peniophora sp. CONT]